MRILFSWAEVSQELSSEIMEVEFKQRSLGEVCGLPMACRGLRFLSCSGFHWRQTELEQDGVHSLAVRWLWLSIYVNLP